ncbi:unnamed protein product, partial [Ixodes pacificus]
QGVTIVKPIVYGNVARYFGKKRDEDGHTHQWTVYLKPYKNEDMSTYVKKVHFKLHESYPNQNRGKQLYHGIHDSMHRKRLVLFLVAIKYSLILNVVLVTVKLQFTVGTLLGLKLLFIASEHSFFSSSIFSEPSAMMQQLLTSTRQLTLGPYKHECDFEEKKEKTLHAILSAKNKIRLEVADLKERLKVARETIDKYKTEISKLESQAEVDPGGSVAATS